MTSSIPAGRGLMVVRTVLLTVAAFILGVIMTIGVVALASRLFDDSRSNLTLGDLVTPTTPGFENAAAPSADACEDRFGCVEGVVGDGVAMYRYASLDLARQAVIYDQADVYRSDRVVIEFEDDALTADERYQLRQVVEGTWTGSSD